MVEECCSTQLVDANGVFNVVGLENFVKRIKLADCGLSYAVVSIMGPQSSGKSTLLNHLFYTNFREMDAFKGRMQTTKGIWIARAVGIEPCTVVLDLEGTDGRESGDDDTAFEKQSALFALAISDIVLINMWCHDIGREHADNKPLLRTVFQVMMRLFTPRKTTLLFVIRDKTKTPFEYLEPILRDDTQKIWDAVPKPQAYKDTPLSEFFNVEVTALPSYEEKEAQFKEQVSQLRQRFFNSIAPGGLTGDRRAVVPASGFSYSAHQIWKIIRENKDLDLPTHKVMVATVRCEEIANENFSHLSSDERWLALEEAVKSEPVSGLGKQLSMILETYFSEYDMETVYFDEGVRNIKRKLLESKALELIYPAYATMLGHLRVREYERFKTELEKSLSRGKRFAASVRRCKESCMLEFDRGCADATVQQADWDASKVREKLSWDIESYASSVRNTKLLEIISYYEKQLSDALGAPVESLLEAGRSDSWVSIRKLMQRESNTAILSFQSSIVGFELDQATCDQMVQELRDYARSIVEKKAREEAGKVLLHMKDKFSTVFYHDKDSMPRVWTGKEDIKTITRDACVESLRILSVMAVIRLEDKPDNIERILFSSLMHTKSTTPSEDLLASSNWDQISSRDTLITPTQCKYLWRQFKAEIEYTITQAISAQEAYKRSNNWLPPAWAILAMIILGLNEFMLLLRNPLCLIALFVVFLLSKAMWVQMDVSREFQNGVVAGLTSVASRFFPTMVNILTRLAGEGQQRFALESQTPASRPRSSTFRNESHGLSSVSSAASEMSGSSSISFMESSSDAGPRLTHRHARNIDAQVS